MRIGHVRKVPGKLLADASALSRGVEPGLGQAMKMQFYCCWFGLDSGLGNLVQA